MFPPPHNPISQLSYLLNIPFSDKKNPKDKRKQDKLDDISDELLAAIAQVEGQVRSEAPVVAAGDRGKKKVDKLNEAARSGYFNRHANVR